MFGAAAWLVEVICAHSSRINNDLQSTCWQACCATVVRKTTPECCATWSLQFFCLQKKTKAVNTSCQWPVMTISVNSEASEMMIQSYKVISGQPSSLCRTMKHLFLPSVFTLLSSCNRAAVSGWHMASSDWGQCLLALHCLCWKITPAQRSNVDKRKRRTVFNVAFL